MSVTLTTQLFKQPGSQTPGMLSDDQMQQAQKRVQSRPLARFCSLLLALARISSLGCSAVARTLWRDKGGGVSKFVIHRPFQAGNGEKPRFSLNYEGFFTLPLTPLNKKS